MKFLISIFFVAGSLTMIQMLDSALSTRAPKSKLESHRLELSSEDSKTYLSSSVPKRPPFNDEGPGGLIPIPPKRVTSL